MLYTSCASVHSWRGRAVIRTCAHSAYGTDTHQCPKEYPMRDWRQVIQQWVAQESRIALLAEQHAEYWAWMWARALPPPPRDPWPAHLPTCQALQDFYRRCDGGSLEWFQWFPLSQLAERNREWGQSMREWDARGAILDPARHVVFAQDAGGCPVVWDASTDEVRAFQVDGGDWESPLASTLEAFVRKLFNPVAGEQDMDESWYLFLNWLDSQLLLKPPQ